MHLRQGLHWRVILNGSRWRSRVDVRGLLTVGVRGSLEVDVRELLRVDVRGSLSVDVRGSLSVDVRELLRVDVRLSSVEVRGGVNRRFVGGGALLEN